MKCPREGQLEEGCGGGPAHGRRPAPCGSRPPGESGGTLPVPPDALLAASYQSSAVSSQLCVVWVRDGFGLSAIRRRPRRLAGGVRRRALADRPEGLSGTGYGVGVSRGL